MGYYQSKKNLRHLDSDCVSTLISVTSDKTIKERKEQKTLLVELTMKKQW